MPTLPKTFHSLKQTFLYDGEFLTGKWSNNTEYVINAGDLDLIETPNTVMELTANDYDEIYGEILNERICESLPLAWSITIKSPEPGLSHLFKNRPLYIQVIRGGRTVTLAEMKITYMDKRQGIIHLEKVHAPPNFIPDKLTLAKNLPNYDEDLERLLDTCAESRRNFLTTTSR